MTLCQMLDDVYWALPQGSAIILLRRVNAMDGLGGRCVHDFENDRFVFVSA